LISSINCVEGVSEIEEIQEKETQEEAVVKDEQVPDWLKGNFSTPEFQEKTEEMKEEVKEEEPLS